MKTSAIPSSSPTISAVAGATGTLPIRTDEKKKQLQFERVLDEVKTTETTFNKQLGKLFDQQSEEKDDTTNPLSQFFMTAYRTLSQAPNETATEAKAIAFLQKAAHADPVMRFFLVPYQKLSQSPFDSIFELDPVAAAERFANLILEKTNQAYPDAIRDKSNLVLKRHIDWMMEAILNYDQFLRYLNTKAKTDSQRELIGLCHSFLILPIQRIPRYELLLKTMLANLPDNSPLQPIIEQALQRIIGQASLINPFVPNSSSISDSVQKSASDLSFMKSYARYSTWALLDTIEACPEAAPLKAPLLKLYFTLSFDDGINIEIGLGQVIKTIDDLIKQYAGQRQILAILNAQLQNINLFLGTINYTLDEVRALTTSLTAINNELRTEEAPELRALILATYSQHHIGHYDLHTGTVTALMSIHGLKTASVSDLLNNIRNANTIIDIIAGLKQIGINPPPLDIAVVHGPYFQYIRNVHRILAENLMRAHLLTCPEHKPILEKRIFEQEKGIRSYAKEMMAFASTSPIIDPRDPNNTEQLLKKLFRSLARPNADVSVCFQQIVTNNSLVLTKIAQIAALEKMLTIIHAPLLKHDPSTMTPTFIAKQTSMIMELQQRIGMVLNNFPADLDREKTRLLDMQKENEKLYRTMKAIKVKQPFTITTLPTSSKSIAPETDKHVKIESKDLEFKELASSVYRPAPLPSFSKTVLHDAHTSFIHKNVVPLTSTQQTKVYDRYDEQACAYACVIPEIPNELEHEAILAEAILLTKITLSAADAKTLSHAIANYLSSNNKALNADNIAEFIKNNPGNTSLSLGNITQLMHHYQALTGHNPEQILGSRFDKLRSIAMVTVYRLLAVSEGNTDAPLEIHNMYSAEQIRHIKLVIACRNKHSREQITLIDKSVHNTPDPTAAEIDEYSKKMKSDILDNQGHPLHRTLREYLAALGKEKALPAEQDKFFKMIRREGFFESTTQVPDAKRSLVAPVSRVFI